MLEVLDISQAQRWDELVKSFTAYDVYYLSGYVRAFQIHGDGVPELLYYEGNGLRAIYVYMKRQTAIEGIYDAITPYGYGGVLFEGNVTETNLQEFWSEFVDIMHNECIVDNFVRYHPVLQNAVPMSSVSTVIDLGKTIAIDLSSPELIWENFISKNRNMIRKAEKNGIQIHHGKDMRLFDDFKRIYNVTMKKDDANKYYFFEDEFYESIHKDLHDNYEMFYAEYDGRIIAMSIMIFANGRLNYHLSGSDAEYRNLAPSNLLLYQAALWGCEQGMKTFHLGGGVGSGEDNLYKFKAAFNKNSDYQFSIGKEIFDEKSYNQLVKLRRSTDANFDMTSSFFPLYRAGN
jgi:hypothetical protein